MRVLLLVMVNLPFGMRPKAAAQPHNKSALGIACVASVSNRVIAQKLERKQKKNSFFPLPLPRHSFFFLLSQLSRRTSRGNACYAGYPGDEVAAQPQQSGYLNDNEAVVRKLIDSFRSFIQNFILLRIAEKHIVLVSPNYII